MLFNYIRGLIKDGGDEEQCKTKKKTDEYV
jgi:hypothetical protein